MGLQMTVHFFSLELECISFLLGSTDTDTGTTRQREIYEKLYHNKVDMTQYDPLNEVYVFHRFFVAFYLFIIL